MGSPCLSLNGRGENLASATWLQAVFPLEAKSREWSFIGTKPFPTVPRASLRSLQTVLPARLPGLKHKAALISQKSPGLFLPGPLVSLRVANRTPLRLRGSYAQAGQCGKVSGTRELVRSAEVLLLQFKSKAPWDGGCSY